MATPINAAAAGFTLPADSDPVSAGAAAIRANAERTVQLVNDIHGGMTPLLQQDLNNVTTGGIYFQGNAPDATAARNYPVTAGGILEVFDWTISVTRCVQRYTDYGGSKMYIRRNVGSWSAWVQL